MKFTSIFKLFSAKEVVDLVLFARDIEMPFVEHGCTTNSAVFALWLCSKGIKNTICQGRMYYDGFDFGIHCWNRVWIDGESYLIDVTYELVNDEDIENRLTNLELDIEVTPQQLTSIFQTEHQAFHLLEGYDTDGYHIWYDKNLKRYIRKN